MDLQAIRVLETGREPRGLESGQRAAFHAGDKQHDVVNRAGTFFFAGRRAAAGYLAAASFQDHPLFDNRLQRGADHLADFVARDEAGRINGVGTQIAERPAAGHLTVESPHQRHVGPGPIL